MQAFVGKPELEMLPLRAMIGLVARLARRLQPSLSSVQGRSWG